MLTYQFQFIQIHTEIVEIWNFPRNHHHKKT